MSSVRDVLSKFLIGLIMRSPEKARRRFCRNIRTTKKLGPHKTKFMTICECRTADCHICNIVRDRIVK